MILNGGWTPAYFFWNTCAIQNNDPIPSHTTYLGIQRLLPFYGISETPNNMDDGTHDGVGLDGQSEELHSSIRKIGT